MGKNLSSAIINNVSNYTEEVKQEQRYTINSAAWEQIGDTVMIKHKQDIEDKAQVYYPSALDKDDYADGKNEADVLLQKFSRRKKESPPLSTKSPKKDQNTKGFIPFNYGEIKDPKLNKIVKKVESVEKEIPINKEEELIINFVELADELALEVQKDKADIKEYTTLLSKYKNIILKHERTRKE